MTNGFQNSKDKAQILLVEDDVELAELTADYLSGFGYLVEVVDDGLVAIEKAKEISPDLILLDVMLPGLDGLEVCKQLRHFYNKPIMMLTARTDHIDQILGLEIGADDYICKPVEPRLLVSRIKALLRRTSANQQQEINSSSSLKFGDLVIDNSARRVVLAGNELEFTSPEHDLLWLLASQAGNILSRAHIFEKIRGIPYDGQSRFVDIHISHIRTKIGDDPTNPERIKTIRNKGYLFVI